MKEPEQSAQSERTHPPRGGGRPTSIQLVLNWTHIGVFVAVASFGLITLIQGFASINQRMDDSNLHMDERFRSVEQRIDDLDSRMDERFNSLEQRVDQRFEQVESRLDRVETRLDQVETRLDGVGNELSGINARLAVVEHIVGASASAEVEPPPF